MGVFANLVYPKASELVSNAISTTGPLSTTIQALNRFKNYLERNIGQKIELITGFVSDSEAMADSLLDSLSVDITKQYIGQIDTDIANDLRQAVYNVSESGRVFVSDANGHGYFLKAASANNADVLLYNLVPQAVDSMQIQQLLELIIAAHGVTGYEFSTIHSACVYVANNFYSGSFDDEEIITIVNAMGSPSGSTLRRKLWDVFIHVDGYESLIPMVQIPLIYKQSGIYKVNNLLTATTGDVGCLYDVVYDLISSEAIDEMLLDFTRLATSGISDTAAVIDTASRYINSTFASVSNAAKHIKQCFLTGGLYGLAKAILDYGKTASSISDSDGILNFTDNNKLVPEEYLAGLVTTAVNTLTAVATLVAAAFNQVVGFAVAIIGTVVSSIVQAINYDYSSSLASVVDGADVLVPVSPHAGMRGTTTLANAPIFMKQILEAGYSCGAARVVGGYILFGPASFTAAGAVNTINWEFHPSLEDSRSAITSLRPLFTYDYAKIDSALSAPQYLYLGPGAEGLTNGDVRDAIVDAWENLVETTVWDNTGTGDNTGYLSDADDTLLLTILSYNFMLFQAYIGVLDMCYQNGENTVITFLDNTWNQNSTIRTTYDGDVGGGVPVYSVHIDSDEAALNAIGGLYESAYYLCWFNMLMYFSGAYHNVSHTARLDETSLTWGGLAHLCNATHSSDGDGISALAPNGGLGFFDFDRGTIYDEVISFSTACNFAVKTPAYNRSTFWSYVILGAVITTVAVVATIAATLAVRKVIRRKQAQNAAKVYKAYDDFTKDPSDANYAAYDKARRKNNIFSRLTGGTVFDKVSVWNSTDTTTHVATVGTIFSKVTGFGATDDPLARGNSTVISDLDEVLQEIKNTETLIDGVPR